MTGDEFDSTAKDVETYILPLFRRLERTTTTSGDGVVILDDSTCPERLHIDGAYRLSTEMITAGTVPQLGGARKWFTRRGGRSIR
jgi:hypothetical protein